jgi:hypothetical protein
MWQSIPLIRLLDGTAPIPMPHRQFPRAHLAGVADTFAPATVSAWSMPVAASAFKHPGQLADAGVENANAQVDA